MLAFQNTVWLFSFCWPPPCKIAKVQTRHPGKDFVFKPTRRLRMTFLALVTVLDIEGKAHREAGTTLGSRAELHSCDEREVKLEAIAFGGHCYSRPSPFDREEGDSHVLT